MAEGDVFAKLSRILETHSFSNDDFAIDNMLQDFAGDDDDNQNDTKLLNVGRTPFDVWRAKQKATTSVKESPKLSGQQWDTLVGKMHQSTRLQQSAMVREQNQGLAHELGGHDFKPRINKTSAELAKTMKALQVRLPEMLLEREAHLKKRRETLAAAEVKECTFKPERFGATTSDKYLRRMGRKTVTPQDFFKYKDEKLRRNNQRKQIVDEIESRELTFKPQVNRKSQQIQEKLVQNNVITVDPTTRNMGTKHKAAVAAVTTAGVDLSNTYEGPVLLLESDHPYKHNSNEYTPVSIANAVSYVIRFDENTATEAIHDFVKFYKDDAHDEYWGSGKYSGGMHGSPCNWPGLGNRPALAIGAAKFILHFRSNGAGNDWGFKMMITPLLMMAGVQEEEQVRRAGCPEISQLGRSYCHPAPAQLTSGGEPSDSAGGTAVNNNAPASVHDRLYSQAVEKVLDKHNEQADLFQSKLKLTLRPWELAKGMEQPSCWTQNKTHLAKPGIAGMMSEVVTQANNTNNNDTSNMYDSDDRLVTIIEYDDSLAAIWRQLRNARISDNSDISDGDKFFRAMTEKQQL